MSSTLVAITGIGGPEIIIILVIVLLLFGARRLPEMGRSLGQGMREFKNSVTGKDRDEDEDRDQRKLESRGSDGDPAQNAPATEQRPARASEQHS
jgi:sec-independent protein translocase protein TatA